MNRWAEHEPASKSGPSGVPTRTALSRARSVTGALNGARIVIIAFLACGIWLIANDVRDPNQVLGVVVEIKELPELGSRLAVVTNLFGEEKVIQIESDVSVDSAPTIHDVLAASGKPHVLVDSILDAERLAVFPSGIAVNAGIQIHEQIRAYFSEEATMIALGLCLLFFGHFFLRLTSAGLLAFWGGMVGVGLWQAFSDPGMALPSVTQTLFVLILAGTAGFMAFAGSRNDPERSIVRVAAGVFGYALVAAMSEVLGLPVELAALAPLIALLFPVAFAAAIAGYLIAMAMGFGSPEVFAGPILATALRLTVDALHRSTGSVDTGHGVSDNDLLDPGDMPDRDGTSV